MCGAALISGGFNKEKQTLINWMFYGEQPYRLISMMSSLNFYDEQT